MIHHIVLVLEIASCLGTVASVGFYVLCLYSAARFLGRRKAAGEGARSTQQPAPFTPAVSILKPLRGTDPEMYESFRSHCLQDYPAYEIIFGVSEADDPAAELVERLQAEFKSVHIRLVLCMKDLGANTKVSNLAQMLPEAQYEHIVVNDSDIRVEADYLRNVMALLEDPKVGLVTCLYRGVASPSLGSRLESLSISTDFSPGVLAARQLEGGLHFGLGSTLAFRRSDLASAGGFDALSDYLADDYEIGRRIAGLGLKVELSETVVDTFLPRYDMKQFLDHQLRWARTIRDSRPGGYFGLVATFGLPWAMLALLCAGGAGWAWVLLGAAVLTRYAVALAVGRMVLRDQQVTRWLALVPLRDLVAVLVWFMGCWGHTVTWRGKTFELKNGKLADTLPVLHSAAGDGSGSNRPSE
ncbi:MAG TPA: bacteriohopanetetrol glucosamine biosynthesis glycosyltransferase HpnI [Terriglobales bacterium]|nr:bacteriohopanetetrol glucosamine biosynthesis glycosyltransferase HpnI [Terriglobales bacterium]